MIIQISRSANLNVDRFVGTGTNFSSYNTQRRTLRSSFSVPETSSPPSADRIRNGFKHSVSNKKRHASEIESYPHNELASRKTESELPSSTIKERNITSNPCINRSPENQIGRPVFITFENNSRFRIPISAEVHQRNNNSLPRKVENIMMDIKPRNLSRHPSCQAVSFQIIIRLLFFHVTEKHSNVITTRYS